MARPCGIGPKATGAILSIGPCIPLLGVTSLSRPSFGTIAFLCMWILTFGLTGACQNREPQLGSGCEQDAPKGLGLIDRAEAEETGMRALNRSTPPAGYSFQIERIDALCLTTLGWYEDVLLKGQTKSHTDPASMPIWIIQANGRSTSTRPLNERVPYTHMTAIIDARTGEWKGYSVRIDPLLVR